MKKHCWIKTAVLLLLLSWNTLLSAQTSSTTKLYLHCGRVIDGVENQAREKQTIVVEGKVIQSILPGYVNPPAGIKVVDLKDKTVMPGLIDCHVHLEWETSPKRYEETFRFNDADIAFRAQKYAQKTLEAGFTTVRDLGGSGINVSLRNAVNDGLVIGPRILTAEKSIATTGGHADPSNGIARRYQGTPGPAEGVINGPDDAREAVRYRYKNGADCIKITATGGVLSVAKDGQGPQFSQPEANAVVETAKEYGFHVAAHAHGDEGMRRAILAGVTSIEHGSFMSDATMQLMKDKGTWYVPTLTAGQFVTEKSREPGYYPAVVAVKAASIGPAIQETFTKSWKLGVKIAFGTDAGVFPHGTNAKEFLFMAQTGYPAMDCIKSATAYASTMLGLDKELGTLQTGKQADIIAVNGNPLENIQAMLQVPFVMKGGVIYKQP